MVSDEGRPPRLVAAHQPPPSEQDATRAGLREVMSRFATGVTVLTASGADGCGMTANSFVSVSLDPAMVLCCVIRSARIHQAIVGAGSFGVSVLGADQEGLARYFADSKRPTGPVQFDRVNWFAGRHTGAPILAGSLAWLECELAELHEGGTHSIFLGNVRDSGRRSGAPLVFFDSGFHQGMPPALSA
jgi:flavin reductase (DIM6/NTAB) family NADH-FMN oxidoreductase RutF